MSQWVWIGIAAFIVYRTAKGVYYTRKFKHLSPEEAKSRLDKEKIFLLVINPSWNIKHGEPLSSLLLYATA